MSYVEQELSDLLGVYTDLSHEVYKEFLFQLENDGLNLGLMFQSKFRLAKPGQEVPFELALPSTHSRVITTNHLKKRDQTGQIVSKDFNLRELMPTYFVLFEDDEVELTISYYKKVLVSATGKVGEIKFQFDDLLKDKSISPGELLTVNIKLLKTGPSRPAAEIKARFGQGEEWGQELASAENLRNILSRISDEKLLAERLKMFGFNTDGVSLEDLKKLSEQVTDNNLGLTEVNGLDLVLKNFTYEKISNEELMKLAQEDIEIVNLTKMQDWLTRIGYDGRVES